MSKCALITLFVVVAGCQRSDPTPTTFQLDVVTTSPFDASHREQTLTFQTPPNAEVIVEVDGHQRSVVSLDELNSDGTFSVKMNVSRKPSDIDGKSKFTTLIRLQAANGAYAGGPSTYTKDSDLELTDVLLVEVDPGEYPLGTPVNIGSENGVPIRLTVRSTAPKPPSNG